MSRRAVTVAVCLAVLISVVAAPTALGDYQGSSLFENVAPDSATDGRSLAERYPLNHYGLDHHVTIKFDPVPLVGDGVDLSGIPALVLHEIADGIWDITKTLIAGVITVFTWAFSLDLLQGRGGALAPVARAAESLYDALGREWLAVAIALVGGWATWRAIVQRQYANTMGQLAVSVVCVLIAMVIVSQPQWTIGGASRLGNELSLALLSIPTRGDVDSGRDAKRDVSDHLFRTLIHDPWVVLNFGGLEHCVDDHNRPVKPRSRDCRTRIDHRRKYAERWLRAGPPGSRARDQEYEALRQGKVPEPNKFWQAPEIARRFAGYHISDADKPAVDIQQQAMAGERLGYAALIFVGSLGAVILLGALSVGVVLAQVMALLLFAFGPFVLLAAVFPGAGHATFRVWAERMLFAITRKIWYGVILSVVLAVSTALLAASNQMGWLLAFGLQCAFYWAVLLYRREIYGALVRAIPGTRTATEIGDDAGGRARSTVLAGVAGRRYRKGPNPPKPPNPPYGDRDEATRTDGGRLREVGRRLAGAGGALAGQYAAQGHANQMVAAATDAARTRRTREMPAVARGELEREYARAEQRLQAERQRRQRIAVLQSRTPTDPRSAAAQRQELSKLRRQGGMSDEEYRASQARLAEASRRRQKGTAAFTKAEVDAKVQEIQARDEQRDRDGSNRRVRPLDGKASAVADVSAEEDVQAQVERDARRLRRFADAQPEDANGDRNGADATPGRGRWRGRRGKGAQP